MQSHLKLLTTGVLFGVFTFFLLTLDLKPVQDTLNQYNLLPKSESFSELYFENHRNLSNPINPNFGREFRFTVRNLENKPFTYNYTVMADSTQSATLLGKGSFSLGHDEKKTITEKISTAEAVVRTKISVTLENKNQEIHFWVNPQ